jgi:hypothetical protein
MRDHGTACLGIACVRNLHGGLRYGIALDALVHFGKVLDDDDEGTTTALLEGIYWAVDQRADIISMSVATDYTTSSAAFDRAGTYALSKGCLVIGGAGNVGSRPVCQPANCWSIMAVGSVDDQLKRSPFSSPSGTAVGGKVDIAAPGERIRSAGAVAIGSGTYKRYDGGTSLAVPHVAGIAALWAEATGGRGADLWQAVVSAARPIDDSSMFSGAGLVRAPGVMPQSSLIPGRLTTNTTSIVVTLDPAVSNGDNVMAKLQAAGLKVLSLTVHGQIVGSIAPGLVQALEQMPGVTLVQSHHP